MTIALIVGALAVVAVGEVFVWMSQRSDSAGASAPFENAGDSSVGTGGDHSVVEQFESFAQGDAGSAGQSPDSEAEYVADGLRRLAAVVAARNPDSSELSVDLRVAAEHVLLDSASTENTVIVRTALIAAADALAPPSSSDRATLRGLAEAITPSMPLPGQSAALRRFFSACADTIGREDAPST